MKLITLLFLLAAAAAAQPHPSATLTWVWSQGTGDPASGFHLYRSPITGGPYTFVAATQVGTLTYTDTSVVPGYTYYYTVTAFNTAGDSGKSPEVTCTIPFQVPGTPSSMSGTSK